MRITIYLSLFILPLALFLLIECDEMREIGLAGWGDFPEPPATPTPTVQVQPTPKTDPDSTFLESVEFVSITGGTYTMGSPVECFRGCDLDEFPQVSVTVSDFEMMTYAVTYEQFVEYVNNIIESAETEEAKTAITNRYAGIVDYRGSEDYQTKSAVNGVTWNEAMDFCAWLDSETGTLPTEAQWEYAATGGNDQVFPWGGSYVGDTFDGWNGEIVNSGVSCGDEPCDPYILWSPVDIYPAGISPFGLYNMSGNVWEYTSDYYLEDYYSRIPDGAIDPNNDGEADDNNITESYSTSISVRGGSYKESYSASYRAQNRFGVESATIKGYFNVGFRCIR